jgi:hypothetical protein
LPAFTFGPNQLFLLIVAAAVFAIVCAVIWYLKTHCGLADDEKSTLDRTRHFSGFALILVTAVMVFLTGQEQGAAPNSIKRHVDPPVVERTPRSVIEETNAQHAQERRQARRYESQTKTEELEEDSQSLFDKLWEQERAKREAESNPE